MPNLIPQSVLDRWFFGWTHPAGRLIFSLLAIAIGLAIVFALIRPPLPRKILRPKQGVPLAIALFFIILGAVLMVAWRLSSYGRPFFSRRGWESVPDDVVRDLTLGPTGPGS